MSVPIPISVLASIPSPGSRELEIGPLNLRFYGLMIALGVLAAVWLCQRRWQERGGDPDDIAAIAIVAVPAGLVGARLYHVITDWHRFEDDPLEAFAIWRGGLGIPGGMLAGILAGLWVVRRRGLPALDLMDVAAPALPLAQAIGRLGNWFNQELYGRPTDLPWGLEIDPPYRPEEYRDVETFHPTFLYESLWNLALAGFIIWIDRKRVVPRGRLLAIYVLGYGVGRLWVEALRVDPASELLGVRVNIWVSLVAIVGAAIVLWRSRGVAPPPPPPGVATDEILSEVTDADGELAADTDVTDADGEPAAEAADTDAAGGPGDDEPGGGQAGTVSSSE